MITYGPISGDTEIYILLGLIVLFCALLVIVLVQASSVAKMKRRIEAMTRGSQDLSLEEMLTECMSKVDATDLRTEAVEHAVGILQAQIPRCIQRVNMIRFDAFEDVGGQQSFSIALLDAIGDGVVITSVYSRSEIRVYSKAIRNGQASHPYRKRKRKLSKRLGKAQFQLH